MASRPPAMTRMTSLRRGVMYRTTAVAIAKWVETDGHRPQEIVEVHVGNRCALDIVVGGGVEADVDSSGAVGDGGGVPLDGRPVEHVEPGDVRAVPPSRRMRWATCSRVAAVRPVRCTWAPSRAYARATAEPIAPAPPWTIAVLFLSSMGSLSRRGLAVSGQRQHELGGPQVVWRSRRCVPFTHGASGPRARAPRRRGGRGDRPPYASLGVRRTRRSWGR